MSNQTATTVNNEWIQLQVNVFTRWVQNQLKYHNDLSNGVALRKDTPRNWAQSPKRTVEMVQNCD